MIDPKAFTKRIIKKAMNAAVITIMKLRVAAVKSGFVIKRPYAAVTAKRRLAAGLGLRQNLYGNDRYSGKPWRTLDSWKVENGKVLWTRSEAATIYGFQTRRLGINPLKVKI